MRRDKRDRDADRQQAADMVTDLRAAVADLRSNIKALPAPAQRTAAQRRDAVRDRTLILLVRAMFATWGVSTQADRDTVES